MRYNNLGNTGLFVSELCLGTMTFGGAGMWTAIADVEQDGATALVKQALDAGVNFLDTANVYSNGLSEKMTGQALKDIGVKRSEVIVATKALGPMGEGVNDRGASRHHLLAQIDASLDRLGLDYVDLYQIHGWDPATPIEETLRGLDAIVGRAGRAMSAFSNWAAWQIMKSRGISELRNLEKFVSLQAYYSLAGRDLEREIVPLLESEGMGLMVWSPLAGGFLSGKYTRDSEGEGRRANFDFPPVDKDKGFDVIDVMRDVAEGARLHRGAGRAGMAAQAAGGLDRYRRRQAGRPAGRQSRLGRCRPDRGGHGQAQRGERAGARISRLDARAAGHLSQRRQGGRKLQARNAPAAR